jgi:hypothetical protein
LVSIDETATCRFVPALLEASVYHPEPHVEHDLSTRYPVIGVFPNSTTLVENVFHATTTLNFVDEETARPDTAAVGTDMISTVESSS